MPEFDNIQRYFDKIDMQLQRIMDRLDMLPTMYMSRQEYEPRHKALEEDIKNLEQRMEIREQTARAHIISIILAIVTAITSVIIAFFK